MMEEEGVTFTATFKKAFTSADGGWTLSLELSEDSGDLISQIVKMKNGLLQVAIVPIPE